MFDANAIQNAMSIRLDEFDTSLPSMPEFDPRYRRAPSRGYHLNQKDTNLALRNALRYIHPKFHAQLAPEFLAELRDRGRIYAYRFRPKGAIVGRPIDSYPGKCLAGKALQVMMDNNLDFEISLYPYELVTYGETGQVCQNWMQYRLTKRYLEELTDSTTLVIYSGHPVGLFKSSPTAPRVMTTNALMIGMFDNAKDWHRAAAIGVANYG
ncbi:MAG: urocanate hydratase, partial [Proteobacteria bacterium]|nr:urocanate hydratase [Pseudomonadota bacterium]